VTVDLYGDRPGRPEPVSQLDQYRAALAELDEGDAQFVLLSIGGNDAGFGEVAKACVGPGDCSEIGARWLDRLDDVRAHLDAAYEQVDEAFEVPVHVVPYPMPLADHGCWWSWLGEGEVRFLAGFVHELNAVIASAAAAHGFDVVETMETVFEPDRLRICDRNLPRHLGMNFLAMNPTSGALADVVNPLNWIHNSLHPNETGHAVIERAIEAWITDPTPAAATPPAEAPPIALSCDGDRPPLPCLQPTDAWEGIQLRSLLRLAVVPLALAVVGGWLLVAPWLRWATEHGVSLGHLVLGALGRAGRWARRRTTR
jgi:lysophospholipase L1-like esterase